MKYSSLFELKEKGIYVWIFFLIVTPLGLFAQPKMLITFRLKGIPDSSICLFKGETIIDSTVFQNGEARFYLTKINPEPQPFLFKVQQTGMAHTVWVENTSVTFVCDPNTKILPVAIGSQTHEDYRELMKSTKSLEDSLNQLYLKLADGNTKDSISNLISFCVDKLKGKKLTFLETHQDSYISTYLLLMETSKQKFTRDEAKVLFKKLSYTQQNSKIGNYILKSIAIYGDPKIGNQVPEIVSDDIHGQPFLLSKLIKTRKNVILIFWASWCGPCRSEIPEIKEFYKKIGQKPWEIVNISIDENTADWKKAVKDLELEWLQISDKNGWMGDIAMTFGITAIPRLFIINKEGKLLYSGNNFQGALQFIKSNNNWSE